MAVYTVLNSAQLGALLMPYRLGALAGVQGVSDGVENTNYFLDIACPDGAVRTYLFTIFEHLQATELGFYLHWLEQLARLNLPVAPAIPDSGGHCWALVGKKPAALFPKLPGHHPRHPEPAHCTAIGAALGRIHAAALDLGEHHTGPRSLEWLESLCQQLAPALPPEDAALLEDAMHATQALRADSSLPSGLIHGDLFPDNTLFVGDQLTGLLDFFSGGDGPLCYDLGVCANAWCSRADGGLCDMRLQALLGAYQKRRPLLAEERQHWPAVLVLSAMRFWVSRLAARLTPSDCSEHGSLVNSKEPEEFRRILAQRLRACDS